VSATHEQPADLVLTGGRIATMDAARSWASALAVREGKLVGVGSDQAIAQFVGPSTRVIELRGRTVTPGFQDAHVHPIHGGIARLRVWLHDARGREAYLAVIDYGFNNATHNRHQFTDDDNAWTIRVAVTVPYTN